MRDCQHVTYKFIDSLLITHLIGRLPVEEKFYIAAIDDDTAMEYLVPTFSEAGVCTAALVDFLVLKHNDFIEGCRAKVADKDQR